MGHWAESDRLSIDRDGMLTHHRPDAEGDPDEFIRLGYVEYLMWCDADALGVADDHERLLAAWLDAPDGRDVD